ncbi:hypothetical protein Cma02nite_27420 [Cellulomonas marina]|uniref:Na+-driven multidrug efflux pump n=1 Tax=Cellulomonas marina TaxID=988821 RepID=A0A1I1AL62_9CELL|nr:hypothetical protein Cma02nite_27420 [Cellulomonas marina]SFB38096.1 Na+-driven multidrug efflux pump [Cellulomonas marina]
MGVGPQAVAAVTLVTPVLLVLGALATTAGTGGASLVSRSLGAGDPTGAARAAGGAVAVWTVGALTVSVLGLVLLEPLLTLLSTPPALRDDARAYAAVLLAGSLVATGFSALIRAEGRLRYATAVWLVPVLVQIALDPLLVLVLDLGVRGAALGTVGGQLVSAAMSAWFFVGQRDRPYRIRPRDLLPDGRTVGAVLSLGAPAFLAGAGTTVVAVLVNAALARADDPADLAGYALAARVVAFVTMPFLGIAQGLAPVLGYNAGRGLHARVAAARRIAVVATTGYGCAAAVVVALAAPALVGVFTAGTDVAAAGTRALRVLAVGVAVSGLVPVVAACCQAVGRPRPSYVLTLGTLVAVRIPAVLVAAPHGTRAVLPALAVAEVLSAVCAAAVLRLAGPARRAARTRSRTSRAAS